MEYSGFLSENFLAFFAMKRMRTAVNPPVITPPMPRIFVKESIFSVFIIMNKIRGAIIVYSQAFIFVFLKSYFNMCMKAIESAR